MADPSPRLSGHDQVLVNALMSLVLSVVVRAAEQDMYLDIVRKVLPHVDRDHFYMRPLAEAADRLLAARSGKNSDWTGAVLDIQSHLARLTAWRLGLLLDNMTAKAG